MPPLREGTMTRISACLFAPMLAIAACSSSASSVDIATTPLSGKVGGQPWTFQVGETNAFLSDGEDDFFASLYAQSYTACGFGEPSEQPHVLGAVPKVVGDYDLDLSRNFTFVDAAQNNLVATDGRIVIDSVTDTTVTGGLHTTYNGDNEVNGRFTLTICTDF